MRGKAVPVNGDPQPLGTTRLLRDRRRTRTRALPRAAGWNRGGQDRFTTRQRVSHRAQCSAMAGGSADSNHWWAAIGTDTAHAAKHRGDCPRNRHQPDDRCPRDLVGEPGGRNGRRGSASAFPGSHLGSAANDCGGVTSWLDRRHPAEQRATARHPDHPRDPGRLARSAGPIGRCRIPCGDRSD
jgi:hypothetical protein